MHLKVRKGFLRAFPCRYKETPTLVMLPQCTVQKNHSVTQFIMFKAWVPGRLVFLVSSDFEIVGNSLTQIMLVQLPVFPFGVCSLLGSEGRRGAAAGGGNVAFSLSVLVRSCSCACSSVCTCACSCVGACSSITKGAGSGSSWISSWIGGSGAVD